jgi:hypothetical protein
VNEYGLEYAKLDFSVITSAYVNEDSISGCYATDHPYHRDHQESFIVIYERLLELFDELQNGSIIYCYNHALLEFVGKCRWICT